MNFIKQSFTEELRDPFISLQALSEWTGKHVNTLRYDWKQEKLDVKRLSPRCLRVRMSEALRYAGVRQSEAA